ncbi:MAG: HlyD family efflux transporter periplasmic adaptor subunit [Planctomycetes bacterium]|nr:HlyD family efflux transporter periplasmic adaptor subunit [Planctomycetota bacterium]
MVDVIRQRSKTRNWAWRVLLLGLVGATGVWGADGLLRLEPASPRIGEAIFFGTVVRGPMVREVSGRGPLAPTEVTLVTADVGGQIVDVPLEPGVEVEPGAVLLAMKDPAIERNLLEAQRALRSAEADRDRFNLLLEQDELDVRTTLAQADAAWQEKKEEAEMKEMLANRGFISGRDSRLARVHAERALTLLELQVARVENLRKTSAIQLQDKEAAIARAHDDVRERQRQLGALSVRATTRGILQELGPSLSERWEVGQRVTAGARVAKITDPRKLKAVIEVSDVQAREVMRGQAVVIDTRTAEVPGRVMRIDPAIREGKVAIDVELLADLPPGARPDLEVFGKIEIERLNDVLHLTPRPVMSEPESIAILFRVTAGDGSAERVRARFGRASLDAIEIVEGLQVSDRVIVSDTSGYEDVDRVLLPNSPLKKARLDQPAGE